MKKKRKSRTHPREQQVKCRKEHLCDACGTVIKVGEFARLQYSRSADYNDKANENKQTGIYYGRWYFCQNIEECNKRINPEDYE